MIYRITGATGFIGRHLMSYLETQDLIFVGYTRQKSQETDNIKYVSCYDEVPGDGTLIHLAEENRISFLNSEIAQNQIDLARALTQKKFHNAVYLSSAAVYQPSELSSPFSIFPVGTKEYSQSLYAETKIHCEKMFLEHNFSVIRPANIYGPRMSAENVLTKILNQRNQNVIRVRTLAARRDYLWIQDLIEGILEFSARPYNRTINMGTERGISIQELIEIVCKISGNQNFTIEEELRNQKMSSILLDCQETFSMLKWKPKVTIEQGLMRLIESSK